MDTYRVQVQVSYFVQVDIEAETPDEIHTKAKEKVRHDEGLSENESLEVIHVEQVWWL